MSIADLRRHVLFGNIPDETKTPARRLTLRGKIWKTFLAVDKVSADEYLDLVKLQYCDRHHRVRGTHIDMT